MNYFAIDLGATSGRTILCTVKNNKFKLREISRFSNSIIEMRNHYYWDIYALYNEILNGLKIIANEGIKIESIGIDTWGVDFAFVGKDGDLLRNPYSYRDPHTKDIPKEFFNMVSAKETYELTGIQVMDFNSLFQLFALHKANNSALKEAESILFVPDVLTYLLTGNKVTEYTIASTSQLLNPRTKQFEKRLLDAVGITNKQFGKFVFPGDTVGNLSPEIQKITGLGPVPVIAVAEHDTASAVAAVPTLTENFAYLSSGTWSLMGIETQNPIITEESKRQNFTNEGGLDGSTRFLKNICGMWLLERCRAEWAELNKNLSYSQIIDQAISSDEFKSFINPDDACFANPDSMITAIKDFCKKTDQPIPETPGEFARCIFESLALRYRQVFTILQSFAPFRIEILHIIGGGSQNTLLNQFTSNSIGIPVYAGPSECTAIGNCMIQAKSDKVVKTIKEMRQMIADSSQIAHFLPTDRAAWNNAYERYLEIYNK